MPLLFNIYTDDDATRTTVGTQTEPVTISISRTQRTKPDGTYDKSPLDPLYFKTYWNNRKCPEQCSTCNATVDKTSMSRHKRTLKCQLANINNKRKEDEKNGKFNIIMYNLEMAMLFQEFGKFKS
jgi:hypothetical protein